MISFSNNSQYGEHVIVNCDVKPGKNIGVFYPLLFALNAKNYIRCSNCWNSSSSMRCSRCKIVKYCCKECQKRSWVDIHKLECDIIASLGRLPESSVLLAMRFILISRKRNLPKFVDHWDILSEKKRSHFLEMAEFISHILACDTLFTARVLAMLSMNAFSVVPNGIGNVIGTALFPASITRINHSCSPNILIHFEVPGIVAYLNALTDISAGEQLFISYVQPTTSTIERQSFLLENYLFQCSCKRCLDIALDKELNGFACQSCGLTLSNGRCKCGWSIDVIELQTSLSKILELKQSNSLHDAVSLAKKWLSPNSLTTFAILLELADNSISNQDFQLAKQYYGSMLKPIDTIFKHTLNHPNRGLYLYTHAKLCQFCDIPNEALDSYMKAYNVLLVATGPLSSLVKDLSDHVEETSKVLSYKDANN